MAGPTAPPGGPAPFPAARAVGAHVARALWLVLWGSLAYFALTPANRAPQVPHDMIAAMASGEPGWLAALDKHSAALVAQQGLAASIVLAVALAIVAVGVFLPLPVARATLILAIVLAAVTWVVGEAFGTILTGGGTDPNSGPLLALLVLTYWPSAATVRRAYRAARWPTIEPRGPSGDTRVSEPTGAGGAWTEERRRSDEGRRRVEGARRRAGDTA